MKAHNFGLSKTLLVRHQDVRGVAKLGLREHESLLAMGIVSKEWVATKIFNGEGKLLTDFQPKTPTEVEVGAEDVEQITKIIRYLQKGGDDNRVAEELV